MTISPAIPLLVRLLGPALNRSGSFIFQKISRLKKVNNAYLTGHSISSQLKSAVRDFETVVGSYHGKLDITLDAFLREFERSGLITALADNALLDQPNEKLKEAFDEMFFSIFGKGNGDPTALFNSIHHAIKVSLEERYSDPSSALLLKASAKQLIQQNEKILSVLADRGTDRANTYNHKDAQPLIKKLSRSLAQRFRDIRVETNKGAKPIEIGKIFIPSKLSYRNLSKQVQQVLSGSVRARHQRGPIHTLHDQDFATMSYGEFQDGFRRVVVLGDPGGGKSTLCQYLCYQLAKTTALHLNSDEETIAAQNQKLPLHIVLRSYELARKQEPQLSVFEYLIRDLSNYVTCSREELSELLLHVLHYGQAVLAFDGLDEILETSKRREFVSLVSNFTDQFPLCPVIVTSRMVGYENAPLPESFDQLILQRFAPPETEEYVSKFLRVYEGATKEAAALRAKQFMAQTDQNASDLRQNPLLLGLMAFLYSVKGDVPSNRPEIYKECAVLMFEKWDQNRSIRADIPDNVDLLHLFSDIASKIYGNTELEEGVTKSWLKSAVEEYFRYQYENRERAAFAARSLVVFLTDRSWVMSEFGADIFKFTHRTFLEYFYARHLDEKSERVSDVFSELKPHILANDWEVISHLTLHMKGYRHQRRTIEIVDELCKLLKSSLRSKKQQAAATHFAARALEYLPAPEANLREVLRLIYRGAIDGEWADTNHFLSIISEVSNCALERRQFVCSTLVEYLLASLQSSNQKECALVANAGTPRSTFLSMYHSRPAAPIDLGRLVRKGAKQRVFSAAKSDPFFARLAHEWYGELSRETFRKFGLDILIAGPKEARDRKTFDPISLVMIFGFSLIQLGRVETEEDTINRRGGTEFAERLGDFFAKAPPVSLEDVISPYYSELDLQPMGIPLGIWSAVFTKSKDQPVKAMGAISAFQISHEISEKLGKFKAKRQTLLSQRPKISNKIRHGEAADFQPVIKALLDGLSKTHGDFVSNCERWFANEVSVLV